MTRQGKTLIASFAEADKALAELFRTDVSTADLDLIRFAAFSGGDKGIEENLKRLWMEQGDKLSAQFGIDPKVMAYLGKAAAAR